MMYRSPGAELSGWRSSDQVRQLRGVILPGRGGDKRETYRLVAFSFDDDAFARVHSALDLNFDALLVRDRTLAFAFLAPAATGSSRSAPA